MEDKSLLFHCYKYIVRSNNNTEEVKGAVLHKCKLKDIMRLNQNVKEMNDHVLASVSDFTEE